MTPFMNTTTSSIIIIIIIDRSLLTKLRNSAKAHSESALPWTNKNSFSGNEFTSLRFNYGQEWGKCSAVYPCRFEVVYLVELSDSTIMHPHDPSVTMTSKTHIRSDSYSSSTYFQGWQLASVTAPEVLALTWANTKGLLIFSASRTRFVLFQAGVTDVKMHGVMRLSLLVSLSYHPTPNPSPIIKSVAVSMIVWSLVSVSPWLISHHASPAYLVPLFHLPFNGRRWSNRSLESKDWLALTLKASDWVQLML